MNHFFEFKQFLIHQDQCAMKIGTDAVLLGSWVEISPLTDSILDIGSGTGVITLMLAQRSNAALIEGVEVEPKAYEQCVENFENSNWNDRLFCYHADFKDFAQEIDDTYDLIVCNPPYFESSINRTDLPSGREIARFKTALSYQDLLEGVVKLLSPSGQFALTLPFQDKEEFLSQAMSRGLYCHRITNVRGHADAPLKRSLMQFSFTESTLDTDELIIEITRHQYTPEYKNLTQDFYLKM